LNLHGSPRERDESHPLHAFRYLRFPIAQLQLATVLQMIQDGASHPTQCSAAELLPEFAPYVDGRVDPLPGIEYRLSDSRALALVGRYGTQLQATLDGQPLALSLSNWMELCHDAILISGPFDVHVAALRTTVDC
jgi:hypothetical protein